MKKQIKILKKLKLSKENQQGFKIRLLIMLWRRLDLHEQQKEKINDIIFC